MIRNNKNCKSQRSFKNDKIIRSIKQITSHHNHQFESQVQNLNNSISYSFPFSTYSPVSKLTVYSESIALARCNSKMTDFVRVLVSRRGGDRGRTRLYVARLSSRTRYCHCAANSAQPAFSSFLSFLFSACSCFNSSSISWCHACSCCHFCSALALASICARFLHLFALAVLPQLNLFQSNCQRTRSGGLVFAIWAYSRHAVQIGSRLRMFFRCLLGSVCSSVSFCSHDVACAYTGLHRV